MLPKLDEDTLTLADEPQWACVIAPIHQQVFAGQGGEKELATLLGQPYVFALLSSEQDYVTSYAVVQAVADDAEILYLAVHPDRRNRGLAKRLLEAIKAQAFERGCCRVLMEVAEDNIAAIGLYSSWGAKQIGYRHHYYQRSNNLYVHARVMAYDVT